MTTRAMQEAAATGPGAPWPRSSARWPWAWSSRSARTPRRSHRPTWSPAP